MSAIRAFQKQCGVALGRILGPDRDEIGGEFHFAVRQINRVREINDALIVGVGDGHGKINASDNAFIWSALTKWLGTENVRAGQDLDVSDASVQEWNG